MGNKPPIKNRRVSPLKPGMRGIAHSWVTAQMRGVSYSKEKQRRLYFSGGVLFIAVLWLAMWLGGFLPVLEASKNRVIKNQLVSMGFVVKRVDVVGEGRIREAEVRGALGVQPGDYLFDMDINSAQRRVQDLQWVDTAVVRRLWPSRIVVHINERTPFALWQKDGVLKVIDHDGIILEAARVAEFNHLPFFVGAGAQTHAREFYEALGSKPAILARASAFVFVGQRRWNVLLDDGELTIMLPSQNFQEALARLDSYDSQYGLLDRALSRVDLRVKGRIYLRPSEEKPVKKRRRA